MTQTTQALDRRRPAGATEVVVCANGEATR
jgi:hypothetical protein